MGKDLDMKTIIKYAAMAAAAYIAWKYVIEPMLAGDGTATPVVAGATDKPAAANTGTGTPAANPTPANPASPAHSAPPVSVVPGEQQKLATALQLKAGVALLGVDGWNYYLRELNPNAVVTDLSEVSVKREDKLNVAQYLALRVQAKLDQLGGLDRSHGMQGGYGEYFVN